MEDFKVLLGIELNDDDISSQIRNINPKDKIKVNIDLEHVDKQVGKIRAKIQSLNNIKINLGSGTNSGNSGGVQGKVNELTTAYNKLKNISKNIGSIKIKLSGLDVNKDVQQIKILENQLRSLTTEYHNTVSKIKSKGNLSSTQWQTVQHQIDNTKIKLEQLSGELSDAKNKFANNIRIKLDNDTFDKQVYDVITKFNNLHNQTDDLRIGIDGVKKALKDMASASSSGNTEALIEANKRYERSLKSVQNQLAINSRAEKENASIVKLAGDRTAFQTKIDNWLKKNSAAAGQFGAKLKELRAQAQACDRVTLNRLESEFRQIDRAADLAGRKTLTFTDRLKAQFTKYSSYFSVASVFMYTSMAIRDMFNEVVAIDSAMTELKKVTDETTDSYNNFLNNAGSKAKEIGTTIDGLVSSTADFARLGFGFKEAQGLAEVANIYAVVGDEIDSVETATQSLISTMTAFRQQAGNVSDNEFAMDIIDKFNEVANNFAISSGGIGEAFQRSASSMAAANNTIDESIALITAANTVVQDPDSVGTAFKTISMRIRGAKTELEEAGLETEGMVESTAKLREEILALTGVDIMLDKNTFKSTYAIMEELAGKWQNLTDIQQASVTELIAGKRQGNIVSALMTNFDIADEALKTSLDSSGSAMAEHEKWMESLEAKLLKLQAAWQSLSQTFMNSNFLKGILESVIGLVDGLNTLIDAVGVIPTLIGSFAAFKSLGGRGLFKIVEDEAALTGKKITNIFALTTEQSNKALQGVRLKSDSSFANMLKSDVSALNNYRKAVKAGEESTVALGKHMGTASESAIAYAQSKEFAAHGIKGFVREQRAAEISNIAQNKSLTNARAIIEEYNNGCKKTGMAQKDFVSAISKTNPALGQQLTSAKSAKSAMSGYITSLVGAKVASLGLQVATMALNMAITMGVGALIGLAVKGLDKAIVTSKELSEQVDELTSKYKEQHEELLKIKGDYDTSNEKSMINRYRELSKGVDGLGKNVSLTSDEYSEYQSIVNDIASQIPSLVSGYDEQGNAILSCKGNVEELTAAYEKLIHEQNREILTNSGDIEKDFKNKLTDLDTYNVGDKGMTTSVAEGLEEMYNNKGKYTTSDDVFDYVKENFADKIGTFRKGIEYELEQAGIDTSDGVEAAIAETLKTNPDKIKSILDDFEADFEAAAEDAKTIAQATLSEAFDISGSDYAGMSDTMQNLARQVVSGFDGEFYANLVTEGINIDDYINGILDDLNNLSANENTKIETALNLKTQFNNGDVSYGEYINGLKKAETFVNGLDLNEEVKEQILLSLNTEEVVDDYDALTKRLTEVATRDLKELGNFSGISDAIKLAEEEAKEFLNGLTASEYAVAVDLIANDEIDLNDFDIDSLREYIEKEAKFNEAMSFTIAMDVETESIEALNTAMAESVSGAGLSSESIASLKGRYAELESQGYDLSAMFEETTNGIHLNREAVAEFEQSLATQKLDETRDKLTTLKERHDDLTDKINASTDASERAGLYAEREAIIDKINDLGTLASQYEGLASAYQKWQSIESAGSERDMYEGIIEGFENIEDELSRGWLDDGTIAFLELLTGKTNLASKSGEKLKEIYDGLDDTIKNTSYSISDFFTVDEDGNSTNAGVYNFLDAIGQLEEEKFGGKDVVKRDEDGNIISFDFEVAGGDEAIAEALGISEELVQIMARAADDAGFVVTIDGSWTQYADLVNDAENANNSIKKLAQTDKDLKDAGFGKYDFNFGANTIEEVNGELEKAKELLNSDAFKDKDGKFNIEAKGAKDALKIAETLQIAKSKLEEPAYMSVDTTKLQSELQEPVSLLQSYEEKAQRIELLSLTPDINKDEIDKLNDELDGIVEQLQGLSDEQKVKLGIDGMTPKQIREELENGTIEIPTELTIEANMDKSLEDLVTLGLLEQGLITKKEAKIRLGLEVDKSKAKENVKDTVDEIDVPEKTIDVITRLNAVNVENYRPDEISAIVKYLPYTEDVDKYTPEEKEAIAKYLADTEGVESYTPEEKEAIAKFKADHKDVDEWTPHDRSAVARFLKDSAEVDNWQPEGKTQEVDTDLNSSEVDNWQPEGKTVTVWAQIKKVASDLWDKVTETNSTRVSNKKGKNGAGVDGTAYVDGTSGKAFNKGNWGTRSSGTALVGELGRETLVRNGRYYTIGDNGAEFIKYQKDDIIFNHKQTEELFKNGKITSGGGRGKALASGTAFSGGSGGLGSTGSGGIGKYSGSGSSAKDYGSKKASEARNKSKDTKDEFEETFDWIEVAISRIERAIDQLDQKANRTYKSWSSRNSNLTKEISKVRSEINLQERAYSGYMAEANSVGLSSKWKNRVQDGTIDISTIKDEDLAEKIKEYQTW